MQAISDVTTFRAYLICLHAMHQGKLNQLARTVQPLAKPDGVNEEFWEYMDSHNSMLTERIYDPLGGEFIWLEAGLVTRVQHWKAMAYRRARPPEERREQADVGNR